MVVSFCSVLILCSWLLQLAMQLVQMFEPDMSQVLYILGHWQLLVDFTLVCVKVLPCDYYLFRSLCDSIYKKQYIHGG